MESLSNVYIDKDNYDLMVVIENPADHSPECISVVKEIFAARQLDTEELERMAIEINGAIAFKKLEAFNPSSSKIDFHKSYFLDEITIKEIYAQKLRELMKRKDDLRFDVWSYAIGG